MDCPGLRQHGLPRLAPTKFTFPKPKCSMGKSSCRNCFEVPYILGMLYWFFCTAGKRRFPSSPSFVIVNSECLGD